MDLYDRKMKAMGYDIVEEDEDHIIYCALINDNRDPVLKLFMSIDFNNRDGKYGFYKFYIQEQDTDFDMKMPASLHPKIYEVIRGKERKMRFDRCVNKMIKKFAGFFEGTFMNITEINKKEKTNG